MTIYIKKSTATINYKTIYLNILIYDFVALGLSDIDNDKEFIFTPRKDVEIAM